MENRGDQDDEMSRRVWEVVKASVREVRMGETKGRRGKRRSRKKEEGKGKEEETEKGENSRSKESSRRMGDMG